MLHHQPQDGGKTDEGAMAKMPDAQRYRSYKGTVGKIAPNVLNMDFKAVRSCYKFVTDVSRITIGDEKNFLSPVLDLFNGKVLGYDISDRADLKQINNMLNEAFAITDKLPDGRGHCYILIRDGSTSTRVIRMLWRSMESYKAFTQRQLSGQLRHGELFRTHKVGTAVCK